MAHSYKKNAAGGFTTSTSEKKDKRIWHKRLRAAQLQKLNISKDVENQIMPAINEVSDPWDMDKDGKHIYCTEISIRKDINGYFSGLKNSSDKEVYFENNSNSYVIKDFLEYFKINKMSNKLFNITDKQKEQFIACFIKKSKRK
ncbi:MAG: hypothetical protein LBQ18_03790 [Campylobacteraceae bacterium]|jgi:hypothetical protein|nr:hypothetical protein [Campylobacteraceae bacterium]